MQSEMRCLLNLNTYFNHVLELWLSTCYVLYMATGADILAFNVNRIEELQDENLLVIVTQKCVCSNKKSVCSNKCACLLALGTTNPCLLCLHIKICPHTHIYIYGKFQNTLRVCYSNFVTTTRCTGSSCLVFRFHPVISLSSFLPSF